MRLFSFFVIFSCLFFSGCAADFKLDKKWRPLRQIVERPGYGGGDTWLTTLGNTVYTSNLDKWLKKHPVDSAGFLSSLHHERTHSIRQYKIGIITFVLKYLTNQEFRWKEEQLGWYVGLKMRVKHGGFWTIGGIANSLINYFPKLARTKTIYRWLIDVKSGEWRPNPADLPQEYRDL